MDIHYPLNNSEMYELLMSLQLDNCKSRKVYKLIALETIFKAATQNKNIAYIYFPDSYEDLANNVNLWLSYKTRLETKLNYSEVSEAVKGNLTPADLGSIELIVKWPATT